MTELEKIITKNFDDEQTQAFDEYFILQGGLQCETGDEFYIEGFKVGLRLGIECMEEVDKKED